MADQNKKGLWRCAERKCSHEFPEAELKIDPKFDCHTCPKCGSDAVFPSDDGGWPTKEEEATKVQEEINRRNSEKNNDVD